jgi:hypothetical protein
MGTRGALGFRSSGTDRVAYNQFDSYPQELEKNPKLTQFYITEDAVPLTKNVPIPDEVVAGIRAQALSLGFRVDSVRVEVVGGFE